MSEDIIAVYREDYLPGQPASNIFHKPHSTWVTDHAATIVEENPGFRLAQIDRVKHPNSAW